MFKRFIFTIGLLLAITNVVGAQEVKTNNTPEILYSGTPQKYIIEDIKVEGAEQYEDFIVLGISGIAKGMEIEVPGDMITQAVKNYWKNGLFSYVSITADKIQGDKIWLTIHLKMRPRVKDIVFHGIKKSEKEDLTNKIGILKGNQITPNKVDRAITLIKRYFDDKGFKNAEVDIKQKDDKNNEVLVDIYIDKKAKIKVHKIFIAGNYSLSDRKIRKAMKKTNEKGRFANIFKTKKFIENNYEEDKNNIISKYNELGYRDAEIIADSVKAFDDKTVDVYISIDEGKKYYLRNVSWVGNTLYNSDFLNRLLQMKSGDVYNQKLLEKRLQTDDDAIGNLYYNNGYLFYSLDPVEVNIVGDSIDLEMRISEGRQATIDRVKINGNTRLYENVVRRELRTRPGDLFSRENLMRSMREIQQMGHFDPENIKPDIQPNPENGTVDISYELATKLNDQIEFSAGWGETGVIGKLSLKFTNFSLQNLLHPGRNYRGILPQGDGQTLTISGQTNAKYYQSYNISFFDPWFGGKRPNSFSVSMFYSRQTDVSSQFYNQAYRNSYMNQLYGGMYGYGSYNYGNYNSMENFADPDKSFEVFGAAVMFGKRLKWPDDYFQFSAELSYQKYILHDWQYFPVTNGSCNNLSTTLTLARSSTDNPIYPRQGSDFSLSVQFTPPYSLFDGKDYGSYNKNKQSDLNEMQKWIEYHKWKFNSKVFIPLMDPYTVKRTPVIMGRLDFGLLGHYNKNKKSPFETFNVGGDGMTGYSTYATESIGLRGYENGSLTPYGREGYAYAKLGMELRYPIMLEPSTSIYVLGFAEAGNAWHNVSHFNPFDLKRSAGVGVRIFLPMIGMMGIDWGYGFDKVFGSRQYSGSQFHFILGREF